MSVFSKLFGAIKNLNHKTQNTVEPISSIFSIKFDSSTITDAVKADIRKCVDQLGGIDPKHFDQIYEAAICSITTGRDLASLFNALMQMNIDGMTKKRASQISRFLHNRATANATKERQEKLGITEAIWLYSGAPCELNPKTPTGHQDAAHKAANRKRYKVSEGMFLDGKWTWPGREEGCKCVSRSVIPALDRTKDVSG